MNFIGHINKNYEREKEFIRYKTSIKKYYKLLNAIKEHCDTVTVSK